MATVQKTFISINGKALPAKIYRERRGNARVSIGKRAAILRMPIWMGRSEQEQKVKWFVNWVRERFESNPDLHTQFFGKGYRDGDKITVGERQYTIRIYITERKTHTAKLKNRIIQLHLSKGDSESHLHKSIQHLLSRVVARDYYPEIERKVNELNNLYFRKTIKSVNLKYNHTNWGSCSSKGNVNLSTRLLFAPTDVIDYVIIHELAHLIELNHSERFWKLVADAMPDYKEKERWLDSNGHLCYF
ncbi:MAG: M48 family metallopeptidase [Saprospiraceae bacterium]